MSTQVAPKYYFAIFYLMQRLEKLIAMESMVENMNLTEKGRNIVKDIASIYDSVNKFIGDNSKYFPSNAASAIVISTDPGLKDALIKLHVISTFLNDIRQDSIPYTENEKARQHTETLGYFIDQIDQFRI